MNERRDWLECKTLESDNAYVIGVSADFDGGVYGGD